MRCRPLHSKLDDPDHAAPPLPFIGFRRSASVASIARLVAGGRDLRRYGSQGQRRLVAILLRLTELSYLEATLEEPCVLLLDDVFSELDPATSGALKRELDGSRQIFVTSPVDVEWQGDVRHFRVSHGTIEPAAG